MPRSPPSEQGCAWTPLGGKYRIYSVSRLTASKALCASGAYRFETLHEVSHWMVDEQPDTVADLLLEWFAAHPT